MSKRQQAKAADSPTEAEDQTDANAAKSSDAEGTDANTGEDSRESLLSVIESAVPEDDPSGDSSSPESEAETESDEETEETEETEEEAEETEEDADSEEETEEDAETEDSEKDPPFHDHPRWKEVVAERDRYKQGAEHYDQIQSFMNANNLEPQEVAEGFQIMSMLKNDPARARQHLEQIVNNLQQFDPNHLPEDLQRDVNEGAVTEERAMELARLRAENNNVQFQNQRTQQQQTKTTEQLQREAQQARSTALATAVNGWEQEMRAKDADYATKAPFVRDRLHALLVSKGQPQSPDQAIALAKQAHTEVSREFKKLKPKKPASKPVPSSGGSSSQKPEPKSLDEAINQAVGR